MGPGRIHHCMRSIGMAERALDLMISRAQNRVTFGEPVANRSNIQDWIAEARIEIAAIKVADDFPLEELMHPYGGMPDSGLGDLTGLTALGSPRWAERPATEARGC